MEKRIMGKTFTDRNSRDNAVERVEVLEKVNTLLTLPDSEYSTTQQVAKFYNVSDEAIESVITRHREEVESDGKLLYKRKEIIEKLNINKDNIEVNHGMSIVTINDEKIRIPHRGMRLFSKRHVLRFGLLLRRSLVAKEVRSRLLDIVQDTKKEAPQVIELVQKEIATEKELLLQRVEAEISGDYDQVSYINAQLFALKNKRIKELETTNKEITTNSLTIGESRAIISKTIRLIAVESNGGRFADTYNKFYQHLNYKLGINIKSRAKKKSKSWLDTLSDEEIKSAELIVKNWATELGMNIDYKLMIQKEKSV